jgi:very-short-patch-repair endonuclease
MASSHDLVTLPLLHGETKSILGREAIGVLNGDNCLTSETQNQFESNGNLISTSRWATFRILLSYYRQCIYNEEGADASAFQNEFGKRFLYLRRIGWWYPRPGIPWQTSIPLGPHLSPLLNALPSQTGDLALVIGYPVQAYYKEKEGEPGVAVIRPIFFFTVGTSVSQGCLIVRCDEPQPEVNLGWLEFAFSRKVDLQRSFLSACGLLNRGRPSDEPPGLERGERAPGLDGLVAALSAFMPKKIREPLHIESVPEDSIPEPFSTGIYNRAVLMLAKRTKYTATLLKELSEIERIPDDVLDRTALRHVFISNSVRSVSEETQHEAIVADIAPLNADQRLAAASLLTKDLTVVTGPPGTGKSQVVSSTIANARLRNQTVLFTSRNHKAIDAVIGRLTDPEGRPIIVRTNSKDDPNLKYTFSDAIRDMLAAPSHPGSSERFTRTKDELFSLLDERGVKAGFARRAAEAGMALGELEERRSYLVRGIPEEMALFVDINTDHLPAKAIQKIVQTARALHKSSEGALNGKLRSLFRVWMLFPWYQMVRRNIRRLPKSPDLPVLPSLLALTTLLPELLILEKAVEYARLKRECKPYEAKLNELPNVEETTAAISDLSERIKVVALRAIPMDIQCRWNMNDGVNREELNGLRASLKAMRTGLDERSLREETTRVMEKVYHHILKAFPCWAVTSLSAGSRIPLVPGLFDLAIVDEASQSDIPSAIPMLYRARRAGVVGDPFQLTHASRLTTARDTILRRKAGLKRVEDVRFAYTESSLYDLCAGTNAVTPVFLSETYRSTEEIANYSSRLFYNGMLRVATDEQRLTLPRGMSPGIHWTEVSGAIQSGGGSGCICREEVEQIVCILRTLLLENTFLGTVGVVTPFRQQANRLRDALFESDTQFYESLLRSRVHIDTAHGFQGDERDIIVFSLCAGPDMPPGSRSFLRETGNLFNVAVSRARAVLHVVGNREWARSCGIRHIEDLASPRERSSGTTQPGPWHPHESPWEERLCRALSDVGLEPRPQFPVSGRRLDLALVSQGPKPVKIDIEVDGDCHRNPDGKRKMDDIWRDIQLQGMGWKVMRFWTYQLRENMGACVEKIMKAWSDHE